MLSNLSERLEASISEKGKQKVMNFFKIIRKEVALLGLVLFGSFSKDSWTIGSDLDLLVIGRDLPEEWFEKTWSIARHNPGGLDLFVYSEEEFYQMTTMWHSIILESL
ncbi:MAG: nucleotidyltransferase domain-containing protein [Candidatus Hodarchaeota archaeon]